MHASNSCQPIECARIKLHGIAPLHHYNTCLHIHVHKYTELRSVKGDQVGSLSMSLLQYFAKAKVLPTMEETEIGEKSTTEANSRVTEVLKPSSLKRKAVALHLRRIKLGKRWESIHWYMEQLQHGGASRKSWEIFLKVPFINTSTFMKRRLLHERKVMTLVTSLPFHWRSEDDHLLWEKAWTLTFRSMCMHFAWQVRQSVAA